MVERRQGHPTTGTRPLKVMMTGLRGCPDVQGGVERHVEHLAPSLVLAGCEVEVLARTPYVGADAPSPWRGVGITRIWAPRSRSLEALAHTFLCVLYAGWRRPDILHIHTIGPALLTPLARLLGLKVVITHQGFDYDRQKWGWLARGVLRLGEALGMRCANACIAVSPAICRSVQARFPVAAVTIPNGVAIADAPATHATLDALGLTARRYVLMVGRLVPEKRHLDVIEAFKKAAPPCWRLAIVGAADHPDGYVRALHQVARDTPGVVMAGFQSGTPLAELFANAGIFALPSSHEGLPIALLEALAYGLPALASNIDANTEIAMPEDRYFEVGDVDALAAKLAGLAPALPGEQQRSDQRQRIMQLYGWGPITERTLLVYRKVAGSLADTKPATSWSGTRAKG